MTEIAAKKLYVGDELVYEKPEMKVICAYQNLPADSDGIIDMNHQSQDLSSENITITVINASNNADFTKTFKTSEWLTGTPKLIGDFTTGQVIENTDSTSDFFEVYYVKKNKIRIRSKYTIAIIIYTI